MPESKHRRKGKRRPRPRDVAGPPSNPPPSPTWVPATGATLLVVGLLAILLGYIPAVTPLTSNLPGLGQNWPLVIGFVLLVAGLGFLTRWR